jgi:hypothetical protein
LGSNLLRWVQLFAVSSIDREAAAPRHRQPGQEPRGVTPGGFVAVRCSRQLRSPPVDGMTMYTGLYRIELTGLAALGRLVWLPAVLIAGFAAWVLMSGDASNTAESESVHLATAAETELAEPPNDDSSQNGSSSNPPAATPADTPPVEMVAPVDGLKISSQSWRRGGFGSKALVTFTLRNANDYAVKDIEIFCSFTRRDGSHLTDRKRVIPDTVQMKSRKTFARMHVGFVNINANQAKCSLVTASRI